MAYDELELDRKKKKKNGGVLYHLGHYANL